MTAKLSSKNQITVPADVRAALDVGAHDRITFCVEGDRVEIVRTPREMTFMELRSILPQRNIETSADFRAEIQDAFEERAEEIVRRMKES